MKLASRSKKPVTISTNCDELKYRSAGALLILGLLANSPAQASLVGICSGPILQSTISSGVCAEVYVRVDNPGSQNEGTVVPKNYQASSVPVSVSTIAAGGSAGEATATVSASPGVLRLSTQANAGIDAPLYIAQAQAAAGFTDIGTVNKLPGTPGNIGDPVHATVTIFINGTTTGIAGFDAEGSYLNISNIISLANPTGIFPPIVNISSNGSVAGTYEFDTTIGAPISLTLFMAISAGAGGGSGTVLSTADYSHTAGLFFDFGTPGFFFNSVSGHDYSSAATTPSETPLPATLPLMASTVAGAWLVARRRRNKQKANA
jgi:hypothetical protein